METKKKKNSGQDPRWVSDATQPASCTSDATAASPLPSTA